MLRNAWPLIVLILVGGACGDGDGPAADTTDAVDTADSIDTSDTTDVADTTDASDTTDTVDTSEVEDTVDASDTAEVEDTSDTSDVADTDDTSDVDDTTDTSDVADTDDTSDVADTDDTSDVADTDDTSDVDDTTDTSDVDDATDTSDVDDTADVEADSDGGTIVGPEGGIVGDEAQAEIPAGALASETVISVSDGPPPDDLPSTYAASGDTWAFEPHGLTFALPVTLTIPHEASATGSLRLLRRDDDSDPTWEEVAGASFGPDAATVETTQFSLYAVVRAVGDEPTWVDGLLTWQLWPVPVGATTWQEADTYCRDLTWAGIGDWVLPSIDMLRKTIVGCAATAQGGACAVRDGCTSYSDCWSAQACDAHGCPACGGAMDGCYWDAAFGTVGCACPGSGPAVWSSTLVTDHPADAAWAVDFQRAEILPIDRAVSANMTVRCVYCPACGD